MGRFILLLTRSRMVSLVSILYLALFTAIPCLAGQDGGSRYVGSKACQPCHQKEFTSFIQYAKKSTSYHSIERLKKGLTLEDIRKCYGCHTTGYGRPGGFVSLEKTPELKNAGCEVCHGPGSRHVNTSSPDDIKRKPTRKDCEICHTSERVRAFRYRPIIHGGGH